MATQTLFLRSPASTVVSGSTAATLASVAGTADYTALPTSIKRAKTIASWMYIPFTAANTSTYPDPPSTNPQLSGWVFDAAVAGSYANANWTINLLFKDTVAAGSVEYKAQLWVYNSVSGANTRIGGLVTSGVVTPVIANTRRVLTISAPGIITLGTNDVLYLEVYLKQTVSSGSTSATSTIILDDPTSTLQGCIVTPDFTPSGGGADVTVALTGISGSSAIGALAVAAAIGLSGVLGTGGVGSVSPSHTLAPTGVEAPAALGSATSSSSISLTGVSGTGVVGTVTVLSNDVTLALTGVQGSVAAGILAPSRTLATTGVLGTATVGAVSPSSAKALTGISGSGAVGTVASGRTVAVAGVSATGAVGTIAPSIALAPAGVSGTGSVGTVTASAGGNLTLTLSGVAGTGTPGTLGPNSAVALAGVSGIVAVGTVTTSQGLNLALSGVSGTGAVGDIVASGTLVGLPLFVPELGAGSDRHGGNAGKELYAAMRAAEADSRAARKPIDSITAPVATSIPAVALSPRHVVALEPIDLDEHDRALALVESELAVEPVLGTPEVGAVVQPDEFAGYTQAAFDALRLRAQQAHDREARIAQGRTGLYALGKQVPVVHISPVAYATALAEAQRQFVDDEELAMVLLIAA